jgi:hypothetical protein
MLDKSILLGRFSAILLCSEENSSVGCTSSLNWPSRPRNRSIMVRMGDEGGVGERKHSSGVKLLKICGCRLICFVSSQGERM